MMSKIKAYLKKNKKMNDVVAGMYSLCTFCLYCCIGNRNIVIHKGAYLKGLKIKIRGTNNMVLISSYCRFVGGSISIFGDNNRIKIEEGCYLSNGELHIEDNGNQILIGAGSYFAGQMHIACTEGTKIVIGSDCLFSTNVVLRSGDSHSIISTLTDMRINHAKDISIGDHVWCGYDVKICKGASIGSGSIVGTGAIVTGDYSEHSNCLLLGIPAKVKKNNVTWKAQRLK